MRDVSRAGALTESATAAGVAERIVVRPCDVTSEEQVDALISGVARDYGKIDLVLNNAGFPMGGFAEDVTLRELREQFETNFFGQVMVTRAVLPVMRAQRSGKILMMSSASGIAAIPGLGAYSASKWALEGWSEALRMECLPLGIYVSLIEPGSHESDIWTRNSRIAAAAPTSPNANRSRRLRDFAQKTPKEDPAAVARTVVRIANDPAPRLRYPVGRMVGTRSWLKFLMPWKRYETMVLKYMGMDKE
jgi:NAD(P)-dependent dehydrogenase (short-subunit alcohol dehydrogenase family)